MFGQFLIRAIEQIFLGIRHGTSAFFSGESAGREVFVVALVEA
jgi:hypothetical protein